MRKAHSESGHVSSGSSNDASGKSALTATPKVQTGDSIKPWAPKVRTGDSIKPW